MLTAQTVDFPQVTSTVLLAQKIADGFLIPRLVAMQQHCLKAFPSPGAEYMDASARAVGAANII